MPLLSDDAGDLEPRALVGGSIAVELDWALGGVFQPPVKREHSVLERVYGRTPALADRVRSFWGPAETTNWGSSIELQLLAHHAGILLSNDPGELLDNLEKLCADAPADLRLASEPATDRAALLARLRKLRSSPAVRRRYVKLVQDVWSALAPLWEEEGSTAVAASVTWRARLAEKRRPWREVAGALPECCNDGRVEELEASLGASGAVFIVPVYFASGGSFVDLPGAILIGVRAGSLPAGSQSRARLEPLARRLKAVSDPTRLAMLEALAVAPGTVGELAERFAVAQPTASNHMKLLREAGLVTNGAGADRRKLVAAPGALAEIVNELGDLALAGHRRVAGHP